MGNHGKPRGDHMATFSKKWGGSWWVLRTFRSKQFSEIWTIFPSHAIHQVHHTSSDRTPNVEIQHWIRWMPPIQIQAGTRTSNASNCCGWASTERNSPNQLIMSSESGEKQDGTTCPPKTMLMNLESEMHSHIPPFLSWFPYVSLTICHKLLHPKWGRFNGPVSTSPCRRPSDKIAFSDSARTPRSASSARSLRSCYDFWPLVIPWFTGGLIQPRWSTKLGDSPVQSFSATKIKNRSVAELYLNYIKSPSSTPTFKLCQDWGLSPKTASVVLAAPSVAAAAVAAAPGPPSEAPPGLGSRSCWPAGFNVDPGLSCGEWKMAQSKEV